MLITNSQLSLKGHIRRLSAIFYDICAAVIAWGLAYLLRFNFQIPTEFLHSILYNAAWVLPIEFALFSYFGLYRGIWRFASLPDLKRIINAVLVASLVVIAIKMMFVTRVVIPRSVFVLNPLLLVTLMGGSRFLYRAWKDHHLYANNHSMGNPVLVLGAGDMVMSLLNDLARSQDWRVVGLLDNKVSLHGRELNGVRVLGALDELGLYVQNTAIKHVILAFSPNQFALKKQAVSLANALGLSILTIPSVDDLMSGRLSISQVRKVEVEDLLGRAPVKLDDTGLHDLIQNGVVMVSGAGGSIGSELCRQIIKFQPKLLICLDLSELSLYTVEQEFSRYFPKAKFLYIVGDVKNASRLTKIFETYRPNVVFHAAAYKHVPMMETDNVVEALNNNVLGTYTLAQACKSAGVAKFVLISTDKAVNPTNVMGASKRLAEMVCQGLQEETGTRFVIVRFGNVLGSSGSVIPKFREQIAQGGPITVTHPDITRYFMSIPEATQLVMQAGLMGEGGEIFVLDMGESVKIADLAREMIKLSGLHEHEIEIQYTGLRPGEKLYEELLADDEHTLPTPHEKLRIAIARTVALSWVHALLQWVDSCVAKEEALIKQELKIWVEEYQGDIHAEVVVPSVSLSPHSPTIH
jgi:FlaA1/EpsC-like NDP-sugar epimerase